MPEEEIVATPEAVVPEEVTAVEEVVAVEGAEVETPGAVTE